MNLILHVWRQASPTARGRFETYTANDVNEEMSFLEMLDVVNEQLIANNQEPIAFEHDCREGICGSCGVVVNGEPHGPHRGGATCQLHLRHFKSGDEIWIEPFRAKAFPVLKDLIVDRGALDRIIQAGGYVSVRTGSAPDANAVLVPKQYAEQAMNAAECIGCGACVAACPNAAAMLFTAAKVSHLALLPQGQPERTQRVEGMVARVNAEAFGHCTNHGACEAACPKGISVDFIARLNRELLKAAVLPPQEP
ncbi:MAG: succinate dehydrogenase/fumarate reductase iron-sulfur subunit [Fimbriimonadaceae bacterium]|nr:succinate dehydrogenase/fumarate reductase iron-sulfur subunit [Fimbriimonadaceae bacterium]